MNTIKDIEKAIREMEARHKAERKELQTALVRLKKSQNKATKMAKSKKAKTHMVVTMEVRKKFTGNNINQISTLVNKQISGKKKSGGLIDERLVNLQNNIKEFKGNKENEKLKLKIIKDMKKLTEHSKTGKKLFTVDKNGNIRTTVNRRVKINENENTTGFMDLQQYNEFLKNDIGGMDALNDTLQNFGAFQYQTDFDSLDYGDWVVRVMKSLKVLGTVHDFIKLLKGIR